MPTIYIDDQPYEVEDGDNVLAACLAAGLDLPYFCWHPEMGSVGACRQCALVQYRDEEDTRGRVIMGCMTPVTEGARFSMAGDKANEFRENVIESLMLNHPHDCPVCAEGGECHLQDMTVMVGHRNRRYRGKKNTHRNQYLGPLINHEMNRCISCYRCTRFYNDYAGGTDFAAQGAHDHVYFGRQQDGVMESEFAGNLVEVCPTGVFTDKPLVNDYTRKWDLQSAPSICNGCALGCNTTPGERYGELKRIHNRFNSEVNGYFLCDRGRYGADYVNDKERANFVGLRNADNRYDAIQSSAALQTLAEWCGANKTVVAIGSPRASLESNFLLKQLVGAENYCAGVADHEAAVLASIAQQLQHSGIHTPSMREVEDADAVLILGEDVTNTAPRLALALRQSVRNLAKQMASDARIPLWQDEAVRVLAQDRLSSLYEITHQQTRLHDVQEAGLNLAPEDIALFGLAVAATLDTGLVPSDTAHSALVTQVATSLKNAKRPLVVSGSGVQSIAVVEAAAAIAQALDKPETLLSYCVPESNSLGVALSESGTELSITDLCEKASSNKIDTLIVLENDLYRRAPRAAIEQLFSNVTNLVVLDYIDTETISQSAMALPSASFAEAEGTLVSSEGRAQRHYPVFLPAEQRQTAWNWIQQIGVASSKPDFNTFKHFDAVTQAVAKASPALEKIVEASPAADYRSRGVKIPRQTHRASGRTAMRANISVHEPKQPVDQETPFAFTMEGSTGKQAGALIPFVWSPGWNSNQSVHKFQSKPGGALRGGTPGTRIIGNGNTVNKATSEPQQPFAADPNEWRLLPVYKIFGSEETSARSAAIQELTIMPFVQISEYDANKLGVDAGDLLEFDLKGSDQQIETQQVETHIDDSLPEGCAGYGVGLPSAAWLPPMQQVRLRKASQVSAQAAKEANDV